jgi:hypothetical protein
MPYQSSPGQQLVKDLDEGLKQFQFGGAGIAPEIIMGVTPNARLVEGLTVEGFVSRVGDLLVRSGRVFRFGDDVVFEARSGDARCLKMLASSNTVEPSASALLVHLVAGGVNTLDGRGPEAPTRPVGRVSRPRLSPPTKLKELPSPPKVRQSGSSTDRHARTALRPLLTISFR